jgi:hypothetical protein
MEPVLKLRDDLAEASIKAEHKREDVAQKQGQAGRGRLGGHARGAEHGVKEVSKL